MKLLLGAAIGCAVLSSYAADWQPLGKKGQSSEILELDRSSIVRNGPVVSVWTRIVHKEEFEIPGAPALRARVVASLTDYNCKLRTETTRRIVFLFSTENPAVMAERGPYDPADIIPDTPRDRVFSMVCPKPQKPARKPPAPPNPSLHTDALRLASPAVARG